MRLFGTKGDDFRGIVKGGNQLWRGYIYKYADHLSDRNRTEDAEYGAFLSSFKLSRSQVLTDECGKSHRETGDGQKAESLDSRISAASCNSHLSKLVNIGLDEYIGNRDDGILES